MVVELDAVRITLLVVQQNGWRDIEVQVDIKALADCLQAWPYLISNAVTITDNIYLLTLMFGNCKFSFEHRNFNRCCAQLAQLAQWSKVSQS